MLTSVTPLMAEDFLCNARKSSKQHGQCGLAGSMIIVNRPCSSMSMLRIACVVVYA